MTPLPTGTVTLLFTDIEGSTRLLHELGDEYLATLEQHHNLLRAAIARHRGVEVNTQGDAFFVVFTRAHDALAAAIEAQRALFSHPWPQNLSLRVRMGLHTGEPKQQGADYVGVDLHRGARIAACGHGGQVLLSQTTHALIFDSLPEGVSLRDLGTHRLKDLAHDEAIYQLCISGLPQEFPVIRSIRNRPHNLSPQVTPLIGREKEFAEVCRRFADGVRLVTLTGVGGTGKTRLSLAVAEQLLEECGDGAFFVPLAPITDESLVVPTITQTLNLNDAGNSPLQFLSEHLKSKNLLLVLDNLEQVISAAADISQLLSSCPQLRILASSRIPLHIPGEQEYPVPPLALPGRKPPPPLEQMSQFAAVQLFISRAQSVKPSFAITNENAAAVAEICARLDGLPLAIELAAARVKLLSPQAMLSRMENRLALLTGGARDAPQRQQTLRGAIAWSYDLLEPEESVLFRRLGIFAGGFTLESAAAICNQGNDVLDEVCSLADKSLLRQSEDEQGEPRFWMLETIREFANEKLSESDEHNDIARTHAMYFANEVIKRFWTESTDRDPQADIKWVAGEIDNIRAALTYLLINEPLDALVTAMDLSYFWQLGRVSEGCTWIQAALERTPEDETLFIAWGLQWLGALAAYAGDYDLSEKHFEAAVSIFRELNSAEHIRSQTAHVNAWASDRKYSVPSPMFTEEQLELGIQASLIFVLGKLSWYAGMRGDSAHEHRLLQESWEALGEKAEDGSICRVKHNMGIAHRRAGDFTTALALFKEVHVIRQRQNSSWSEAYNDLEIGHTLYLLGELASARRSIEHGQAIFLEQGWDEPHMSWVLGRITAAEGDRETARQLLIHGLKTQDELNSGKASYLHAQLLEALGCLDVEDNEIEHAARVFGAAEKIREDLKLPLFAVDRTDYDPSLEKARAALDDATFEKAWQSGHESVDEVLAEMICEESTLS